jgi:hypothetical protein
VARGTGRHAGLCSVTGDFTTVHGSCWADRSTHQQSAERDADTPARRQSQPATHRKHSDERRKGKVRNFDRRCMHSAILAVLLKPGLRGAAPRRTMERHSAQISVIAAARWHPGLEDALSRTSARTFLWSNAPTSARPFPGARQPPNRQWLRLRYGKGRSRPDLARGLTKDRSILKGWRAGSRLQWADRHPSHPLE